MLGCTPFPERVPVPLRRLPRAQLGDGAGTNLQKAEALFGCKRKSQWLLHQAQKSLLSVFELFFPALLSSRGIIFSRSQLFFCTRLPKIVHLVRIFLFSPFNSNTAERRCPNIPPKVIIFNDTSSDRKEYGSY